MNFNQLKNNKILKYIFGAVLGLAIISLIVSMWLPMAQAFRVVFGSVYVLLLPGLVLSYVFFNKKEVDIIERVTLSFALSISIVPLLVFYLNLIGMKINTLNVFLVIAFIIFISLVIIWQQERKKKPVENF